MSKCTCKIETKDEEENRILLILLCINAVMFLLEILVGIFSESTALIADSLDMLADATVYGIAIYAVGKTTLIKIKAAHLSGVFQVILGVTVVFDVLRRLIWGSNPESLLMILVGIIAFVANITCFKLISKYRYGEVHMRASWIFSKNDVIANFGIIASGILVYALGSRYPDLIIGLTISVVVIRGGVHIIQDAKNEKLRV